MAFTLLEYYKNHQSIFLENGEDVYSWPDNLVVQINEDHDKKISNQMISGKIKFAVLDLRQMFKYDILIKLCVLLLTYASVQKSKKHEICPSVRGRSWKGLTTLISLAQYNNNNNNIQVYPRQLCTVWDNRTKLRRAISKNDIIWMNSHVIWTNTNDR